MESLELSGWVCAEPTLVWAPSGYKVPWKAASSARTLPRRLLSVFTKSSFILQACCQWLCL